MLHVNWIKIGVNCSSNLLHDLPCANKECIHQTTWTYLLPKLILLLPLQTMLTLLLLSAAEQTELDVWIPTLRVAWLKGLLMLIPYVPVNKISVNLGHLLVEPVQSRG